MRQALVTGAKGFIGRNLVAHLARREGLQVFAHDMDSQETELVEWLGRADAVFHLAGVNRPQRVEEYEVGNAGFTARLCERLRQVERMPKIVPSSSIKAELDNPYGASKRATEELLPDFARATGAAVAIYRLKNVFGR